MGHIGHTIHALARAFNRLPSGQDDRPSGEILSRKGEIPVPSPVIHDELGGPPGRQSVTASDHGGWDKAGKGSEGLRRIVHLQLDDPGENKLLRKGNEIPARLPSLFEGDFLSPRD